MQVITIPCGILDANAYLLIEPENGEAALIDAPCADGRLWEEVKRRGHAMRYLLLTHGHIDHIAGVQAIRDATHAMVGIHPADAPCLRNTTASLAKPMGLPTANHPSITPDLLLSDGQTLPLGKASIEVIHTPGHTPGGVCYRCGDLLFTGDTLFAGSYGRTDFPGGSMAEMRASCLRLIGLPGVARVLPGHGPETTLEAERYSNPIFD